MSFTQSSARAALTQTNVKAFLRVVRGGESSQDPLAYRWLFGSSTSNPKLFDSFAVHPKVRTYEKYDGQFIRNGKIDFTTAAGAYQIVGSTWDECAEALSLPDFSPESQDLAAVYLINRRGALDAVIRGDLEVAIKKCAQEWASLPGSTYGQPVKTMAQCRATYEQYGGRYASVDTSPQPVEKPAAPVHVDPRPDQEPYVTQESSMPIPAIVGALVPALVEYIPKLAKYFPGGRVSERNLALATTALEVVQSATQTANAQAAIEAIGSSPEAREAAAKAVDARWADLHKLGEESVASAREFSVAQSNRTDVRTVAGRFTFIEMFSVLLVGLGSVGMTLLVWGEKLSQATVDSIAMLAMVGTIIAVREFWLGSSAGSRMKDQERSVKENV